MPTLKTAPKTPGALKRARLVTSADVLETCRAAANLSLQGDGYSREDREDVATRLVIRVLERAALDTEVTALKSSTGEASAASYSAGDIFPARLIGFDFLCKRASDERDSIDAKRARLILESGEDSGEESSEDSTGGALKVHGAATAEAPDPLNDGTPAGARRQALRMLADAGLWEGAMSWTLTPNNERGEHAQGALWNRETGATWSAPRGVTRASAPTGALWTLAYTAARAADGLDAQELADELELSRAAHRAQCSRAARELASSGHDIRTWTEALNAEGLDWSAPDKTARAEERTRLAPDEHAPVTSAKVAKRTTDSGATWSRRAKVKRQHDGRKTIGGPDTPVDPLTPNRRARLEKATKMRRARANAKDANALRAARLAAGLPAEVR